MNNPSQPRRQNTTVANLLLLAGAILLVVLPLVIHRPVGDEELFTGADGQAKDAIAVINPEYKPWMNSPFSPPSGEVESLLFALQAALGAGFIGYFFGVQKGKRSA